MWKLKINYLKIRIAAEKWSKMILLLSIFFIPFAAGINRLFLVSTGDISLNNMRFLQSPVPIFIHILSAIFFGLLGAYEICRPKDRKLISRHKYLTGPILFFSGLLLSVSGLWMTQFYPQVGLDSIAVWAMRWLAGLAIFYCLITGIIYLLKKKYDFHSYWMIRSYAIAAGAGTQVFTHIPLFIWPDLQNHFNRALAMLMGWLINIIISEYLIKKIKTKGVKI